MRLIDFLLQNPILLVILLAWLGSSVLGWLAKQARRAQQERERGRMGERPGDASAPQARPSTDEIAAEIRRMMQGEPRSQTDPTGRPPAEPFASPQVDAEELVEHERRRRELREERQRKLAERERARERPPPPVLPVQHTRSTTTLEEELAAKAQQRRDDEQQRSRLAEAGRSRLGTLGGTAAAHEPSRKSSLHEIEGRLARRRAPRTERRTRARLLIDVHEPTRLFLAAEIFGAPRAIRDLEER